MKRIITLMLCALLLITLFAGCKKGSDADANSSTASDGFSTEDISFFDEDGDSKYSVIRPENCSEVVEKSAISVYSAIKKELKLVSIKNMKDTENGDGKYEILIGDTNRPETETARQRLIEVEGGRCQDYIICSIGTKIVILGTTDDATLEAAKYFTENFVTSEVITGGIMYTYKTEATFKDITVAGNNIGKYIIVKPHYNTSYVMNVELEKLESYIQSVSGYPVKVKEDMYIDESEYEIIVGNTNRSGVEDIKDYDEYSIKVNGNKVYLNGGSYYATAMAISEFNKMLEKGSVTSANNVVANYRETVENYDRSTRLNPTWSDEFDGNTIDLKKWNFIGIGENDNQGVNGKKSVRSNNPAHAYVRDGKFTIAASYDDNYYYGGMISSNYGKTYYLYGYIEMSAIIPDGDGFWTTLWMVSEENNGVFYPEVDVNECYGNAVKVEGNYHSWPTSVGEEMGEEHFCDLKGGYSIPNTDKDDAHFGLNFHTFGFMWTPEWVGGTVDGNLYQKFDITQDNKIKDTFSDSMYLKISLANHFANCPTTPNVTEYEWKNTNKLIVDSVYIYQYFDGKHKLNGKVVG